MGIFDKFRKKRDIIDLSDREIKQILNKDIEKDADGYADLRNTRNTLNSFSNIDEQGTVSSNNINSSKESQSSSALGFLSNLASSGNSTSSTTDATDTMSETISLQQTNSLSIQERRNRLKKRLINMTDKIEENANILYKLEQRIDALERRLEILNK